MLDEIGDHNRHRHEAMGNKPHKLCTYSPESRAELYCFRMNFIYRNWSTLRLWSESLNGVNRQQRSIFAVNRQL